MPRTVLQPLSGADPYVLIEYEPHHTGWGWARIDQNGAALEPQYAATANDAIHAAEKRFRAVKHMNINDGETGLKQLKELKDAGYRVD